MPAYDESNIFARILRGEIPCKKVYEDQWALAFHDINPLAPVHVLVIPKGAYVSFVDFAANATPEAVAGFFKAVAGYRILANHGEHAHQEVPHFHVHVFGGAPLGTMLRKVNATD
jgi:diadenosine tetraphosphate (Ap4A) HIT family hydrolase